MNVKETIDSRKETKGAKEALALTKGASRLVAAKVTKVQELDLRSKPARDDILKLMLGPTGNLRAPTFVVGKTLYVGFPKDGFEGL